MINNIFQAIKLVFFKIYCWIVLISDTDLTIAERVEYLSKSIMTITPVVWVMSMFNLWFTDNKLFFTAIVLFVFINMVLGGIMHYKKKDKTFSWNTLLQKTMIMIVVLFLTYLVLELILKVAGSNLITEGFRAALQVATLLYPASKILKNVFILSKGEHPPKWMMEKIHNFEQNGDLKEFLETLKKKDEIPEE